MKLKLVVNGEDKKVRITPEDKSDAKLLEFIIEHDGAKLEGERESYSYDKSIKKIDLTLRTEAVAVQKPFNRQDLIKALKDNRELQGTGSGKDYWESVATVVEQFI